MYKNYLSLFLFVVFSFPVSAQELYISEFQAYNTETLHDNYKEYDDWIELYNSSDSTITLAGLYISDDFDDLRKWQFVDSSDALTLDSLKIPPGSYKILWADNQAVQGIYHVGFKLSANDEQIILSAGDTSSIIDFVEYDQQYADISFGRHPDSLDVWYYFDNPSPGSENSKQAFREKSESPYIFQNSGYYSEPLTIEIFNDDSNAVILYTTNSSIPTDSNAFVYQNPIEINATTVIRAITKKSGYLNSAAVTRSFIFEDSPSLPTVYLVTDSSNMWGPTGIYTNRNNGLEKPVNFEYYNQNNGEHYNSDAGIKIHAPDGRAQQSFRLYARSVYGDNYFNHKFFDQKDINKFKRLILRNGGNDGLQISKRTHLRDLVLQQLYYERNKHNAISAFSTVNVYLNGIYWGLYNLRERQDEYYIEENFPYNGELDLLERAFYAPGNRYALSGDWQAYDAMKTFLNENDMSLDENYAYASQIIDIDNFAEYWIFEVFAGNFDWLINNIRFWKVRNSQSKWRWILWDTDHGFGLPYQQYGKPQWNTLGWSVSVTGERTGSGSNNVIIRNLLKNNNFRRKFINMFADLLNSSFAVPNINRVINELAGRIEPDVQKSINRWGGNTYENWFAAIDLMKEYVAARPGYVRDHIIDVFDLSGSYVMNLQMNIESAGVIKVNTIEINEKQWQGFYFNDIPVPLSPQANKGYIFDHWTINDTVYTTDTIYVSNSKPVICHFIVDSIPELIITEINYHSDDEFDSGDWIELYNPKPFDMDISGWFIKDNDNEHIFSFPDSTIIESRSYLVLSSDLEEFVEHYSNVNNVLGDIGFSLDNKSDQVRIFRSTGLLMDSVEYKDEEPWPEEADGEGATLELKDFGLDNSIAESWMASKKNGGTPGEINSIINNLSEKQFAYAKDFILKQNYPNPFNGRTIISVNIPHRERIKILIFNNRGQLLEKFIDGYYTAGQYTFVWNANTYSSGIYFIQLLTSKTSKTVKSLLIK